MIRCVTDALWPPRPAPLGGDRPDVVGFGEALVLLQPPSGAALNTTTTVDLHAAGAELNVCAAVAALGGSSTLTTRLGDDPLAAHIGAAADRLGVTIAADRDPNRPTGVYFKDVRDDGARHVFYYRSTSAAAAMGPADADRGLALRPRAVVVSGLTAALGDGPAEMVRHVGRRAAEYGCALVVDVNLRPQLGRLHETHEVLAELLPHADLLIVGTDESTRLLGSDDPEKVASAALAAGCREIVVKAGADGCWWVDPDGAAHHQPSIATTVVDPVGAGDAFTGGYLSGRLAGVDAAGSARLASELAARIVATTGDTDGLPRPDEGRRLLATALVEP
jgi:2-dehydro-3-deoxygluconokinase